MFSKVCLKTSARIRLINFFKCKKLSLKKMEKNTHRFACMAEGSARKSDRKLGKEPSFSHRDLELIEKLNREERKKKKSKLSSEVKQPSKRDRKSVV